MHKHKGPNGHSKVRACLPEVPQTFLIFFLFLNFFLLPYNFPHYSGACVISVFSSFFFFFSSLSSFLSSVGKPARFHNFQIRPSIFCRKTSARKCVIIINTSDLYEHTIESFPFSISPYGIAAVLLNMPELLGITVSVKFPPTFPLSAF